MREHLLGWALTLGVCACSARERGPNLIELRDLSPRHAEAGDRVRLVGSGFPEGRSAEVILRGELLRAGEAPVTGVTIATEAELTSPHGLDLTLAPELVAALCGKPDPRHTTFRGDVAVAFAPRSASGSPVGGVLEGVVFDVSPDTTSETTLLALESEGTRFASFLGAKFQRTDAGLTVSEVSRESRAARAGFTPGDRLLELEGRVVRDLRDFVPAPDTRTAALRVERGGENVSLRLETSGFRHHSASALSGAVLVLGLVLAPLVCWWSMLGRALAVLERQIEGRLRAVPEPATPLGAGALGRSLGAPGAPRIERAQRLLFALVDRLPGSLLPYLGLLASSALFTALSLGKTLVGSDLDLFLVPLAVSAGLVAAALASGGAGEAWSLKAGARRALGGVAVSLPPLLALFTRAAAEDTHELRRLVLAQGALPWQWAAFASPAELFAAVSGLLALVPSVGPVPCDSRSSASARLLAIAEWSHKLVLVGALAVAFFGGWRLPGARDSVLFAALGALTLLVKAWLLLGGVVFLRWALGNLDIARHLAGTFRGLALPSALCVLLALGWRAVISEPAFAPLQLAAGKILFAVCVVLFVLTIQRVSSGLRREAPELGVQFWL